MAASLSKIIRAEGIRAKFFSNMDEARTLIAKDRPSLAILEHDPEHLEGVVHRSMLVNCVLHRPDRDDDGPEIVFRHGFLLENNVDGSAPHCLRPWLNIFLGRSLTRPSVMTATTDVVISGKSKLEFLISDFSGIAHSRISTIRMWAVPIPVTVRPKSSMVSALPVQEPIGASHVSISIARAPVGRSNPRDPQEE